MIKKEVQNYVTEDFFGKAWKAFLLIFLTSFSQSTQTVPPFPIPLRITKQTTVEP